LKIKYMEYFRLIGVRNIRRVFHAGQRLHYLTHIPASYASSGGTLRVGLELGRTYNIIIEEGASYGNTETHAPA